MIFKNEKITLKSIRNSEPKLSNFYYDWNDIWEDIQANHENEISEREYVSALNSLSSKGLIEFSSKTTTAFKAANNLLYYRTYCIRCFFAYISEKWIDFLTLIISLISLAQSISNHP